MRNILVSLFMLLACACSKTELPKLPATLKYVEGAKSLEVFNRKGHHIFGERIIKIGVGKNFVVACSESKYDDENFKGQVIEWQFHHIKSGETASTITNENWEYFKKEFPELSQIKTIKISEGVCP
ncbi:hypothetical protein ACUR5C_04565 [Aliikangiella sp. IMCC44653]